MSNSGEQDEVLHIELRIPEGLTRPQFANFVHANMASLKGEPAQLTLTFVHIFSRPAEDMEVKPSGEAVARVVISRQKATALRDLLIRQLPLSGAELRGLRGAASPRKKKGSK